MTSTDATTINDQSGLPHGDETTPGEGQAVRRTSTSYAHDKAKIMARLRRMEGQVRGVQRMVDEDQYCLDVLTQLSAIIAAARQTGLLVLEDHVRGCVLAPSGERAGRERPGGVADRADRRDRPLRSQRRLMPLVGRL